MYSIIYSVRLLKLILLQVPQVHLIVSKESDKMENLNAVCNTTLPAILGGKYFQIVKMDQNHNTIKAMCLTCKGQNKNTVLSGSLRAISNFKVHLKISIYKLKIR